MANDLLLEVLDYNWNRLFITPHVVSARISEELGTVGEGEVTLSIDDEAITYLPDPDVAQNNEGRWKLYEGNDLVFAGIVDQTTKRINADNTFSFGGKQRGILLGNTNVGRRDFNGWPIDLLFDELLRDNIAKSPISSITTTSELPKFEALNVIAGDYNANGNYWSAAGSQSVTIDLQDQIALDSMRIITVWWDNRWYKFTAATSTDGSSFTTRYTKTDLSPLTDRGVLVDLTGITARYVRVTIDGSQDGYSRLSQVFVYQKLADMGSETTFNLSWIENDDSGNVTATGNTVRVPEQGSFNGDGVLGHSFVTRLSSSGMLTHRFRGTANAVYFTQAESGACQAEIRVDGAVVQTVTVPANTDATKYQYKGFEVTNLSDGVHTLSVSQASGVPQIDYFTGLYRTAYRPVNDEDFSIGYTGPWASAKDGIGGPDYRNFTTHRSASGTDGAGVMKYEFEGDLVKVIGTRGPTFGITGFYIDDAFVSNYDAYNSTQLYQQTLFTWSGSYGYHSVMAKVTGSKNASATNWMLDIDGIEGNFAHVVFLRSFYETNLRLLDRMSQITNSFNRFNNDGTIDYLGSVGTSSDTIIREGENEGGTITNAEVQDDYSETCSAVLALVTTSNGLPLKVFTIDKEAVGRMGLKIRKMENADANDAYLLQRQAWVELQEHKYPARRYNVQYHEDDVGSVEVGETTKLYSPKMNLDGSEPLRVGKIDTEWSSGK